MNQREQKLYELRALIELQSRFPTRPNTSDTIADVIDELLEELYPIECTGDPLTCDEPYCCQSQEISPETYAALLRDSEEVPEEAFDDEMEYMTLSEGMDRLHNFKGGRLARKGWDNGLNSEYIEWMPLVGPIKIYQTSRVHPGDTPHDLPRSYFKNVVHTFESTKDDETASDWYFL